MIDWIIPEKINTSCMEDIENTPARETRNEEGRKMNILLL